MSVNVMCDQKGILVASEQPGKLAVYRYGEANQREVSLLLNLAYVEGLSFEDVQLWFNRMKILPESILDSEVINLIVDSVATLSDELKLARKPQYLLMAGPDFEAGGGFDNYQEIYDDLGKAKAAGIALLSDQRYDWTHIAVIENNAPQKFISWDASQKDWIEE